MDKLEIRLKLKVMNDKEALRLLRQINAAFDELNELWSNSISCLTDELGRSL